MYSKGEEMDRHKSSITFKRNELMRIVKLYESVLRPMSPGDDSMLRSRALDELRIPSTCDKINWKEMGSNIPVFIPSKNVGPPKFAVPIDKDEPPRKFFKHRTWSRPHPSTVKDVFYYHATIIVPEYADLFTQYHTSYMPRYTTKQATSKGDDDAASSRFSNKSGKRKLFTHSRDLYIETDELHISDGSVRSSPPSPPSPWKAIFKNQNDDYYIQSDSDDMNSICSRPVVLDILSNGRSDKDAESKKKMPLNLKRNMFRVGLHDEEILNSRFQSLTVEAEKENAVSEIEKENDDPAASSSSRVKAHKDSVRETESNKKKKDSTRSPKESLQKRGLPTPLSKKENAPIAKKSRSEETVSLLGAATPSTSGTKSLLRELNQIDADEFPAMEENPLQPSKPGRSKRKKRTLRLAAKENKTSTDTLENKSKTSSDTSVPQSKNTPKTSVIVQSKSPSREEESAKKTVFQKKLEQDTTYRRYFESFEKSKMAKTSSGDIDRNAQKSNFYSKKSSLTEMKTNSSHETTSSEPVPSPPPSPQIEAFRRNIVLKRKKNVHKTSSGDIDRNAQKSNFDSKKSSLTEVKTNSSHKTTSSEPVPSPPPSPQIEAFRRKIIPKREKNNVAYSTPILIQSDGHLKDRPTANPSLAHQSEATYEKASTGTLDNASCSTESLDHHEKRQVKQSNISKAPSMTDDSSKSNEAKCYVVLQRISSSSIASSVARHSAPKPPTMSSATKSDKKSPPKLSNFDKPSAEESHLEVTPSSTSNKKSVLVSKMNVTPNSKLPYTESESLSAFSLKCSSAKINLNTTPALDGEVAANQARKGRKKTEKMFIPQTPFKEGGVRIATKYVETTINPMFREVSPQTPGMVASGLATAEQEDESNFRTPQSSGIIVDKNLTPKTPALETEAPILNEKVRTTTSSSSSKKSRPSSLLRTDSTHSSVISSKYSTAEVHLNSTSILYRKVETDKGKKGKKKMQDEITIPRPSPIRNDYVKHFKTSSNTQEASVSLGPKLSETRFKPKEKTSPSSAAGIKVTPFSSSNKNMDPITKSLSKMSLKNSWTTTRTTKYCASDINLNTKSAKKNVAYSESAVGKKERGKLKMGTISIQHISEEDSRSTASEDTKRRKPQSVEVGAVEEAIAAVQAQTRKTMAEKLSQLPFFKNDDDVTRTGKNPAARELICQKHENRFDREEAQSHFNKNNEQGECRGLPIQELAAGTSTQRAPGEDDDGKSVVCLDDEPSICTSPVLGRPFHSVHYRHLGFFDCAPQSNSSESSSNSARRRLIFEQDDDFTSKSNMNCDDLGVKPLEKFSPIAAQFDRYFLESGQLDKMDGIRRGSSNSNASLQIHHAPSDNSSPLSCATNATHITVNSDAPSSKSSTPKSVRCGPPTSPFSSLRPYSDSSNNSSPMSDANATHCSFSSDVDAQFPIHTDDEQVSDVPTPTMASDDDGASTVSSSFVLDGSDGNPESVISDDVTMDVD